MSLKQNDKVKENYKEQLMNKYNISYTTGDKEGELNYIGNKNDLRNFFMELENYN